MTNPTEVLKQEHRATKLMLKILEKVSGKLQAGEEVNPQHLVQILEFIQVFTDKCHHGKEERLLFPALEEAGIPREGGPIGVMLKEHDLGRSYVEGMNQAMSRYQAGDRKAAPLFAQHAKSYIQHLTHHIEKEDKVLFPMAEQYLSEGKQAELTQEFEEMEEKEIGPGKHEEFHHLLQQLEKIYLQ